MISRRLIRIKVFKVLFSRINSGSDSVTGAEKELLLSCSKTQELYYLLLLLPGAIKALAERKIEAGLGKFHPTPEEANPNRKFVENRALALLEDDSRIRDFCSKRGLGWSDHAAVVKKIFNSFVKSEYYKEYMSSPERSLEQDVKLLLSFYEQELEDCDELNGFLEDSNLYWSDDLAFVVNIILKKISQLKDEPVMEHPGVFLKDDDRDYALRLLNVSLIRYSEFTALLSGYVLNWETDRLASTDIALIVMGIAEAVTFHDIPLKVTINEYVELSKFYSTPNSKVFVNGMLDKILLALKEQGKVEKRGRGLVGSAE